MDFDIPPDLAAYLDELDDFIEAEIRPLEEADDNIRFFDHRREDARTDWERGGLPNEEWEALLAEARRRADAAGHYRYPFPARYGGRANDRMALRELTDEVMYEIGQLSGYEYVDTYATKQAEDVPSETARVASFADVRTPATAAG